MRPLAKTDGALALIADCLAPAVALLCDHYLALPIVSAAYLAARGHAWGLTLPLLGWLPQLLQPRVTQVGMLLSLLASNRA